MKQKEFGPEMDEREWKFPELSEQAQHYIMSQLLPSLRHYLFIGSMNEVDLSASSTSLFVNSALEDFPCIPMNYFCANQSLNKFSSTDSRNLGVSVCKKTVPSFSSKTLWRELLGPQGCAKPCWMEKANMITVLGELRSHWHCVQGRVLFFCSVLNRGLSTAAAWEELPECFSSLCTISCPHGRQLCSRVRN